MQPGHPLLGPIVCRVVTCVPPWDIDPSCTRTSATDNNTRSHDRPCLHTPTGAIDVVQPRSGVVYVKGWALDPDTTAPIRVNVAVDGSTIAGVTADQPRPDVAAGYRGHGADHGFELTVPASPGRHQVCVTALNAGPGSVDRVLGCVDVTVGAPYGSLEQVSLAGPGQLRVAGWAIDPDSTEPVDVHVYVDGSFGTAVKANGSRPDIAATQPGFGDDVGYDVTITSTGGTRNVCVYAINVGADVGNTLLGCKTITFGGPPAGNLDAVTPVGYGAASVEGWAIDPDTSDPVEVHVYVDGRMVAATTADVDRPDLTPSHPGFGPRHGFSVPLGGLAAGDHQVCAYAINVGAGSTNALLGCKAVRIPSRLRRKPARR